MVAVAVYAMFPLLTVFLVMACLTAPATGLLASAVGFAMTIPLAIETAQRVWYVLSNRDSHVSGCDVRGRLSAIKCEDDSISLSSVIIAPIPHKDNDCIYNALRFEFGQNLCDTTAGQFS